VEGLSAPVDLVGDRFLAEESRNALGAPASVSEQ